MAIELPFASFTYSLNLFNYCNWGVTNFSEISDTDAPVSISALDTILFTFISTHGLFTFPGPWSFILFNILSQSSSPSEYSEYTSGFYAFSLFV